MVSDISDIDTFEGSLPVKTIKVNITSTVSNASKEVLEPANGLGCGRYTGTSTPYSSPSDGFDASQPLSRGKFSAHV